MKCRTCGAKAAVNMRHHRLSLCSEHFLRWLPNYVQRTIEKYNMFTFEDRLLIAVSGGKDSLSLWDILHLLGYQTEGVYIDLGIDENFLYSQKSFKAAVSFAEARGLNLTVYDVKEMQGEIIAETAARTRRGRNKPCSVCGLVKRYALNTSALKGKFDVLVTAHNLDDEAAILLSNVLDWSLDFLSRGYPVHPAGPGFSKKAKPLCRTYERETAAYAVLSKIDYMQEECPFSTDSKQIYYKQFLNQWEDRMPGTKLRFYNNYLKALDNGAFPVGQDNKDVLSQNLCPNCGQPTQTGGLCAFCSLYIHE